MPLVLIDIMLATAGHSQKARGLFEDKRFGQIQKR
jgi:hypothetical protein